MEIMLPIQKIKFSLHGKYYLHLFHRNDKDEKVYGTKYNWHKK